MTAPAICLNFDPANNFVRILAKFVSVPSWVMYTVPEVCAYMHLWYAIGVCLHLKIYSGVVVFITSALLSQHKLVGPSIRKPIIQVYISTPLSVLLIVSWQWIMNQILMTQYCSSVLKIKLWGICSQKWKCPCGTF